MAKLSFNALKKLLSARLGSRAATSLLDTVPSTNTMNFLAFTGKNGAGACTCTGAVVGDAVIGIVNITDVSTATSSFETTITVVDEIQQSSSSNLSTKKFAVILGKKS